jgi:hypothetical protein
VFPGKRTYRYNDDGLLTEERVIQPENNLIRLSQYAYDSHGYHTREWVYSVDPLSQYARDVKVRVDGEDLLFDGTNGLPSIFVHIRFARQLDQSRKNGSFPGSRFTFRADPSFRYVPGNRILPGKLLTLGS